MISRFGNDLENNARNLDHDAKKLQEILNRIMQGIISIITSALYFICFGNTLSLNSNGHCIARWLC